MDPVALALGWPRDRAMALRGWSLRRRSLRHPAWTSPKNDFGRSLFAYSIGRISRWARTAEAAGDLRVVAMLPRYHPSWARWVIRVPGLREVVSWNAVLVLVRQ